MFWWALRRRRLWKQNKDFHTGCYFRSGVLIPFFSLFKEYWAVRGDLGSVLEWKCSPHCEKGQIIGLTKAGGNTVYLTAFVRHHEGAAASERLSISVSGVNPLSSLMCQTSNSVLSHTHTHWRWNCGRATTAGNRHRAELSCHVDTTEMTHSNTLLILR